MSDRVATVYEDRYSRSGRGRGSRPTVSFARPLISRRAAGITSCCRPSRLARCTCSTRRRLIAQLVRARTAYRPRGEGLDRTAPELARRCSHQRGRCPRGGDSAPTNHSSSTWLNEPAARESGTSRPGWPDVSRGQGGGRPLSPVRPAPVDVAGSLQRSVIRWWRHSGPCRLIAVGSA
jgi:hypothetical protein